MATLRPSLALTDPDQSSGPAWSRPSRVTISWARPGTGERSRRPPDTTPPSGWPVHGIGEVGVDAGEAADPPAHVAGQLAADVLVGDGVMAADRDETGGARGDPGDVHRLGPLGIGQRQRPRGRRRGPAAVLLCTW